MTAEKKNSSIGIDGWFKIIGITLTVATIIVGIYQYIHELDHQKRMEFKREVWKKQLDTYSRVCRYSGAIAANQKGEEFQKNINEFRSLYWGEMVLIEDKEVIGAMNGFYEAIDDYHPEDYRTTNSLKQKALVLARACKASSKRTWLSTAE